MESTTSQILIKFGLTENESEVYLGFLKYGKSTAAELARKINMDKSSAYRAVEQLERMSLLIKHPKKRGTTYEAASPNTLKNLYDSKVIELASQRKSLSKFIRKLKKEQSKTQRSTYIFVEKGIPALQFRMDEAIDSKEKLIREQFRTDHRFFENKAHVRFVINHAKKRRKNGVFLRQLEYFEDPEWGIFEDVMVDQKLYKKEIRIIPSELVDKNSFRIWDNTINIVSYDEKGDFIIITIKDKYVAQLMKTMYDFVWRRSRVYDGKKVKIS